MSQNVPKWLAPTSLEEALALRASLGDEATVVAGGTFIGILMNQGIIMPQALRILIPPIGNDTISMLKFTSLVSVLALPDLMYSAQMIYSRTYQTIPLLLVVTVWYLVLATILTGLEHLVERRFSYRAKAAGIAPRSPWRLALFGWLDRKAAS